MGQSANMTPWDLRRASVTPTNHPLASQASPNGPWRRAEGGGAVPRLPGSYSAASMDLGGSTSALPQPPPARWCSSILPVGPDPHRRPRASLGGPGTGATATNRPRDVVGSPGCLGAALRGSEGPTEAAGIAISEITQNYKFLSHQKNKTI